MNVREITRAIVVRKRLLQQMVGRLYPSMVQQEILDLRHSAGRNRYIVEALVVRRMRKVRYGA